MKKFLVSGLLLSLLLLTDFVQAAQQENINVQGLNQREDFYQRPRYGLQLKSFVIGTDFRDNYPHSSTTLELLSDWGWADQVGGWFQFNPSDSLGLIPPQNLRTQSLSSSAIRLDWQNIGQYDDLQLFQGDAGNNFGQRAYQNNLQNRESFVVEGLNANTVYKFYLEAQKRFENERFPRSVFTPTVQGRTLRDEGQAGPEEFSLSCAVIDKNTINLIWAGPSLGRGQSLSLYYAFSERNFERNSQVLVGNLTNTGSFHHQNLEPEREVYYRLKLIDDNGESIWIPSLNESAVRCVTLGEIPQDPSHLRVTALSRNSLHITWRDNAVRPHNWQIERIKITPSSSTISSITALSPNELRISWTNPTNAGEFKSPFYHIIERADNPDFNNAAVRRVSFVEDQNYNSVRRNYEQIERGLTDGTVYYYRLKACSFVRVTLAGSNQEQEVCSPTSEVVNARTLLAAPTNLRAVQDRNQVILSWTDNSQVEDGYEMIRISQNNGERETFILGVNAESTTDDPQIDGIYTYEIKAFKIERGGRIYSEPAVVEINFESRAWLPKPSFAASIRHSVSRFFKSINIMKSDVWHKLRTLTLGISDFGRRISEILGSRVIAQEDYNLENYWFQFRRQLDAANYPSVFTDTGLESDSVYLYRVKGIYTDNNQPAETRYTPAAAGKTFSEGQGAPVKIKVCLRNQFCGEVQGEIIGNQWPVNQCEVNADCVNVGTYRRVIKETKGR